MPPASLHDLLDRSRATEPFKTDVLAYADVGVADRVDASPHCPPVKVLRLLAQLLHAEPELAVERVEVHGQSGCSDFAGSVTVLVAGEERPRQFAFTWCCAWRARDQGWTDWFGFPDQIRAAREFGWDCFERWEARDAALQGA